MIKVLGPPFCLPIRNALANNSANVRPCRVPSNPTSTSANVTPVITTAPAIDPAVAAPIPRANNPGDFSSDAPGALIILLSIVTVLDEGKSDGVPGEDRRATIPLFPPSDDGDGRSDFVSVPDESTSVVAAPSDLEDSIDSNTRIRSPLGMEHRRVGRPVMVEVTE